MSPATRSSIAGELKSLGVRQSGVVMVHAGLRSIGRVVGGAATIVQAMLDSVGPAGTLAAYVDFEPFCTEEDPEIPVFDKRVAPAARDHGVLHETMRIWPGAVRSDHPDAGVVAIGTLAESLTTDHPFRYGYGEGSPFEKIVEAQGQVLMIGAPLDTITLLHFAEHKARIPNKRIYRYRRLMPAGEGSAWVDFEEFDTGDPVHEKLPENCFERIALDFLATGKGSQGPIGQAEAFLFNGRELVDFGVAWIERFVTSDPA